MFLRFLRHVLWALILLEGNHFVLHVPQELIRHQVVLLLVPTALQVIVALLLPMILCYVLKGPMQGLVTEFAAHVRSELEVWMIELNA